MDLTLLALAALHAALAVRTLRHKPKVKRQAAPRKPAPVAKAAPAPQPAEPAEPLVQPALQEAAP
jgi:hypothetical protein